MRPGSCLRSHLAVCRRAEVREEERFAHELSFDRAPDFLPDGIALHTGLPEHVGSLVQHFAGFRVDLLSWLQAYARDLQIVALDGVIERLYDRHGNPIHPGRRQQQPQRLPRRRR